MTKKLSTDKEAIILSLPEKHLVFLDEVGDSFLHEDINVYKNPTIFPVMTITAVIISKKDYKNVLMPGIDKLKMRYFGINKVHFHSREIRRKDGIFKNFLDKKIYSQFKKDIDELLKYASIQIVSSSTNKIEFAKRALEFKKRSGQKYNIGDIYLRNVGYVLERIGHFVKNNNCKIIFETRGRKESKRIQALLSDAKKNGTYYCSKERFKKIDEKILFFNKQDNISGLQIADYCTYPFSRHAKNPKDIDNKLFDFLRQFIYKGDHSEYGLKEWP